MSSFSSTAILVAGFSFFILGLRFSRRGVELALGERLRTLIRKLPGSRFFAIAIDAFVAMMLQSSRAAIVMAVSFVRHELSTLSQAFAVVLGADIGTAFVILFLALPPLVAYAPYLIALGVLLERISKSHLKNATGTIMMGVGLVFFGMTLLYDAASNLVGSHVVATVVRFMVESPLSLFFIAVVLTAILRTTAATIAITIALAFTGVFSFEAAVPMILGANLGAAVFSSMACLKAGVAGKRVALFHMFVKMFGAVVSFIFMGQILKLAGILDVALVESPRYLYLASGLEIALFHLVYNLALAIIFMPLIGPAVALSKKIIPAEREEGVVFGPKYLNDEALETPTIAFAAARQEILRIAKIARDMFANVLEVYKLDSDFIKLEQMALGADNKVDKLERSVRYFLAKISQKNLTEKQASEEISILTISGDLEDIADTIQRDLLNIARKKRQKLARFSEEGWAELKRLHKLILENFDLMISMLVQPHEEIARKMERHEKKLNDIEQDLRQSHLLRLHEGLAESFETSTVHLDILNNFRLINYKLARITEKANETQ